MKFLQDGAYALRMILKGSYDLTLCNCGEEGLQKLAEERFDLVLLDLMMPGIDGIQTLEKIATMQPRPQTIMLTATKTLKSARVR